MEIVHDASRLTEQDVTQGLQQYFEPVGGFQLEAFWRPEPGVEQLHKTWVAWTYHARHSGVFAGIPPTEREVTVRGATLVDGSEKEPLFYRYIDWLDVCQQIGLSISGRPAVEPGERFGR
jgi:hypothetical protein